MRNYKIYLIRNGLTQGALEGRYIGHTDESLCEEGKKQLQKFAFREISDLFHKNSPLL